MQVQTNSGQTKKVKKEFNLGDQVQWRSHANGCERTKIGKIVAVMSPDVNYRHFQNLPQSLYVKQLRQLGHTRDEARSQVGRATYTNYWDRVFGQTYRLKFHPREGMRRKEYHYLVEVPAPIGRGSTPRLYHPKTAQLEKV